MEPTTLRLEAQCLKYLSWRTEVFYTSLGLEPIPEATPDSFSGHQQGRVDTFLCSVLEVSGVERGVYGFPLTDANAHAASNSVATLSRIYW